MSTLRGCIPLTVNVISCSPSGPGVGQPNPFYNYDFVGNPTATLVQSLTFTYPTPGFYTIRQTVNDGTGSIVFTNQLVEVLGKPNPVFSITGCIGRAVRVSITDTNYDSFTLDYGDGTQLLVTAGVYNHVYTTTMPVTISVTGQYSVPCTGAAVSRPFTPFVALVSPDLVDLTVVSQSLTVGSINLRYGGLAQRLYSLDYKLNNGAYTPLMTVEASLTGINTQLIASLNTQATTYTFRIRNQDGCGNSSPNTPEIASIIVNATPQNGFNQVGFLSNGGLAFSSMDLFRANASYASGVVSPYVDNTVICGNDYCYQLQGTLPTVSTSLSASHKSFSASSCVKATTTNIVSAVSPLNSTVEGNGIRVVWDAPSLSSTSAPVSFYSISRGTATSLSNYGSSNSAFYLDAGVSVANQPYCYQLSYRDPCNALVTSPQSTITCTIHLTVTRTDELNSLSWSNYIGYASGVKEYLVENLDDAGNVVLSKSVGLATSFVEAADPSLAQLIYRISAIPNALEKLQSTSNVVRIDLTPVIYMPTIFSPNNDGTNDRLEVKGKYYRSYTMTIFNKWGEVVYVSGTDQVGWDGTYKGDPAPVDAYAYSVVALDALGKEISLKGTVSLVR